MKPTAVSTIFEGNEPPDAVRGTVRLSLPKSAWNLGIYGVALVGGVLTFSWDAFLVFVALSLLTLCLGPLGLHRKLVHESFQCTRWLDYVLVHLGVLIGVAGPLEAVRAHDVRDWAQRQPECHPFLSQRGQALKDWFWQTFCELRLERPPVFLLEPRRAQDRGYRFLEATWRWQQLPWALALYAAGGWPYVIWGIAVRVSVCSTGYWLMSYLAHNKGGQHWHVQGSGIQGFNVRFASLLTMGENWHNNHHAFPGSAKFGLKPGELDLGWQALRGLERLGLVWGLQTPENLPPQKTLTPLG